jgi:hypothetical protein
VLGGYTRASGDTSGVASGGTNTATGRLSVEGYSLGAYWTRVASSGWYSDAVLMATRYRADAIAVLPVAAIEQHGPHLPVSVDTTLVDGVIAASLPHIPADLPVLFLPTQQVGKSNEHMRFPGTLTLSAETLIRCGPRSANRWRGPACASWCCSTRTAAR